MSTIRTNDFIERLYREMYSKLVVLATAKIDDVSLAEDLVQDVFMEALRQEKKLWAYDVPEAWLVQTLKYKVLNFQRQMQKEQQWLMSLDSEAAQKLRRANPETGQFEIRAVLEQFRQTLNQEEFYLLRRVVLEGISYQQVAKEMKISSASCYKRISRIRQKLAKEFPEYAPKPKPKQKPKNISNFRSEMKLGKHIYNRGTN